MYTNVAAFLIPVVGILGAFGVAITAMVLESKAKDRKHRERMFLAEKGLEIPQELYAVPEPKRSDFRGSRAWLMVLGALCIFIGIGVMIALGVSTGMQQGINGVIPLLIGIGFLAAERMIAKLVVKSDRE
jgi:hypothetical protein